MQSTPVRIENLMKVRLNIKTADAEHHDVVGTPFTFIYGVGLEGITPFEKALFGKSIGDRIHMEIPATAHCETLGHLELPIGEQTGILAPRTLEITVTDISRPADREVVKAMAGGSSCSDCGCGCGAH
ncbi:hypothetical protein [Desulfosarcina ovata]|uniref:Uncharacterized protein n=2 Tax=Desulfosarcina ovata TaxID=83564 RepID=A0A5K8A4Z5_9BACT|nr:hypothetical protein [Desulfosarcina ovata]BBO80114.1 hypothetical protein DSCO28_06800 [Desulfosarcina ovata subsp. sediminis]BBO87424.1 hypothetical protein DSCOOX_06040 [Desulfosarcina ovata subsp. ovata]